MLLGAEPQSAHAQNAIERNLPPSTDAQPGGLTIGDPDYGEGDATPFGVDLVGLVLIGQGEEVQAKPPAGITVSSVTGAPISELRDRLKVLIGRPLSRALIVEAQTIVATAYRQSGFPFVSVTVPPQEITSGVLHLRVIEFGMGDLHVEGVPEERQELLRARIRTARGERIDAKSLEEDIDWLNRIQYRRVRGIFSPGNEQATTDLSLNVTETKPWSVLAGWSNTGTRDTGRSRWFAGGGIWLPWLHDLTMSYQVTGSDDLWRRPGEVQLESGKHAKYLSHAGRITLPTWQQQALELVPSIVISHQQADQFIAFRNETVEIPVIYRAAVSNVLPGVYGGEFYVGAETKFLSRKTYFAGMEVAQGNAELFQLMFGWTHRLTDAYGSTAIDLRFKINPGSVLDGNDDATWALFSGGRIQNISYAYAAVDVSRITTLAAGFSWGSQLSGVLATEPLPDTERMSLGGIYATRGYQLDDVSVDTGFVWRNELRFPTTHPLATKGFKAIDVLSPYLFIDLGYGRDLSLSRSTIIAGTGFGFDYSFASNLRMNTTLSYALRNGGRTRSGDWSLQMRVALTY